MLPRQPEPCLGGLGTHDAKGRCYSGITCGTLGYCRERATGHGTPNAETAARWQEEAKQRAHVEQQAYLENLPEGLAKPSACSAERT